MKIDFFGLTGIPFLPLSYGLLKSYCDLDSLLFENLRWNFPIFLHSQIEDYKKEGKFPDIACFSTYMWNAQAHLYLAEYIKTRSPATTIIFGGPHLPENKLSFMKKHSFIDIQVIGEGEEPLRQILRCLVGGHDYSTVSNLIYTKNGTTERTQCLFRKTGHMEPASPFLDGTMDQVVTWMRGRGIEPYGLWETNRGCPYSCTFCEWGVASKNKIGFRPLETLEREIAKIAEMEIATLYVCDANFGIVERDVDIAKMFARIHKETGFPKAVRTTYAKNNKDRVQEVTSILHASGIHVNTTFSFQSLNEGTLQSIRRSHPAFERQKKMLQSVRAGKVPVYSEMILGLPGETMDSFKNGIEEILNMGNHEDVRVYELSILPNTPLYESVDKGEVRLTLAKRPLFYKDQRNPFSEEVDVVVATETMPQEDWIDSYLFAEIIQTFHNGAITRFLAIYLQKSMGLRYRNFYEDFIDFFANRPNSYIGSLIKRMENLLRDYCHDDSIPQVHKTLARSDFRQFFSKFSTYRKAWPLYHAIWLYCAIEKQKTFEEIHEYIFQNYPGGDHEQLRDLLKFQREILIDPDYNPKVGRRFNSLYNWRDFFFLEDSLVRGSVEHHFKDTHLGPQLEFSLEGIGDLRKFLLPSIGISYPLDRKGHFHLQLDKCTARYLDHNETPIARPRFV